MCDTLGLNINGKAIFGKNSDRSPNEPQVLEYHPAAITDSNTLKATYISIPQVKETHAVLLSRPTWLWGAEIGINDCGVCIGNEAVWTLGKYGDPALTGMDLLRLALERSASAKEALTVLTSLLEEFGQGGNCGYDHNFFYDNSFLVMDRSDLFVLETAGRDWVWKRYERASISNRLSIGSDGDAYKGGKACNFALKHTEHLYNIASGSFGRRGMTNCSIQKAETVADIMAALSSHNGDINPFAQGSVNSPCMHFGGLVGDHTTASMVVDLQKEASLVWTTGSSCPCVSLFKPWIFGQAETPAMLQGTKYWYEQETFHRALLGKVVPAEFYTERDEIQARWLKDMDASLSLAEGAAFTARCFEEEAAFLDKWSKVTLDKAKASSAFLGRWEKKNTVLFKEKALAEKQ